MGIAKILRSHYQRPYFLPEDSESIPTDWIFLGGSGPGAHMHVGKRSVYNQTTCSSRVYHILFLFCF